MAPDHPSDNSVFGQTLEFKSSWDMGLKIISVLCSVVILVAAKILFSRHHPFIGDAVLLLIPAAALFMVRGYSLTQRGIEIRRLLWTDEIPYAEIAAVQDIGRDFGLTLRMFGNGGMFSYTGFFWSRRQGLFKSLANNFRNPLLLATWKRKYLLSPDAKKAFLEALQSKIPAAFAEAVQPSS